MVSFKRVEIQDREEFEKLLDHGTVYHRNEEDVIATIVGSGEKQVNFVYKK